MTPSAPADPSADRIAVVTGTGGIGLEAAVALANEGFSIILAGRNADAGTRALDRLRACAPGRKHGFIAADLAKLDDVRRLAESVSSLTGHLDVLLNNAGVMSPPTRTLTADGYELQFGVNHLAHFALTCRLMPLLRKAPRGRVVSVSSIAHRYGALDLEDWKGERSYHPGIFYCRSKLAQATFAVELQRRSVARELGIDSIAAHPGFARTNLFHSRDRGGDRIGPAIGFVVGHTLGHSARNGAKSLEHAATSPLATGGKLYGPRGLFEMRGNPGECMFAKAALDPEAGKHLWELSVQLTGTDAANL